jgi:hypothetical protein
MSTHSHSCHRSLLPSAVKDAVLSRARHSAYIYLFGLFLISLPFTIFATYVLYQLQVVGYLIGTGANGQPCIEYCLVPFGRQKLSVLLYLNALGFGLGGVSAMLISACADFWGELPYRMEEEKRSTSSNDVNIEKKGFLIALLITCYGAISIPAYWMRDTSLAAFNALMALCRLRGGYLHSGGCIQHVHSALHAYCWGYYCVVNNFQ